LFERKNNQPLTQASDQDRRPIFMIANLERDHTTLGEAVDFWLEIARASFDIRKSSCNFPARIKDRGRIFRAGDSLFPGSKQSVARFHLLREQLRAITFRARFRK
jgi:hypothetical protein